MKITKLKLKQIIKEEMISILNENKDWGAYGDRFYADDFRLTEPLDSLDDIEEDHIEVAIRDAIDDRDIPESFANKSTLVSGKTNAEVIYHVRGGNDPLAAVKEVWHAYEETEIPA